MPGTEYEHLLGQAEPRRHVLRIICCRVLRAVLLRTGLCEGVSQKLRELDRVLQKQNEILLLRACAILGPQRGQVICARLSHKLVLHPNHHPVLDRCCVPGDLPGNVQKLSQQVRLHFDNPLLFGVHAV